MFTLAIISIAVMTGAIGFLVGLAIDDSKRTAEPSVRVRVPTARALAFVSPVTVQAEIATVAYRCR
jgi:hypothetical protein